MVQKLELPHEPPLLPETVYFLTSEEARKFAAENGLEEWPGVGINTRRHLITGFTRDREPHFGLNCYTLNKALMRQFVQQVEEMIRRAGLDLEVTSSLHPPMPLHESQKHSEPS